METTMILKALGVAVLAASIALTSAFALGAAIRRHAGLTSHQQMAAESLFEPSTPTSRELVGKGRALFLDSCAHCHGADARGDEGPDLHDLQVSDRYISKIVNRGIPHEMPSFAKKLQEADKEALVSFLRSLR